MEFELDGRRPKVHPDAYIAPTAVLIGDVEIGAGASVWFGAVLRGDEATITVGEGANIQDNAVVHCAENLPTLIAASSPRSTAPNQTLAPASISTSTMSTAVGAM